MRTRRKPAAPTAPTVPTVPTARTPSPALRAAQRRQALSRKVASVLMIGVFALALWQARDFSGLGRWFPELAAGLGLAVSLVHATLVLLGKDLGIATFETGQDDDHDAALEKVDISQGWVLSALGAFPALVVIAGFIPAVVVWMPLFLRYIAEQRWWVALVATAGSVAVLYLLHLYIGMIFPTSWLLEH